MDKIPLETLLQNMAHLHVARGNTHKTLSTWPTGYATLDEILPGAGWPRGTVIEIMSKQIGIGEMRLLLPLMVRVTSLSRWVVWLTPPVIPYAPALLQAGVNLQRMLVVKTGADQDDLFWSMEKILREPTCGLVIAWPQQVSTVAIRRLQLAAEAGQSIGVLIRFTSVDRNSVTHTPAALRLMLQVAPEAVSAKNGFVQVHVLKARGAVRTQSIDLPLCS